MILIIPIFVLLEVLSLFSFVYSELSLPLLMIIGISTLVLSIKNLEWGIYILFGELFIGSRGRLLEYDLVSLRMVIFSAVFVAWLVRGIRNYELGIRDLKTIIHDSRFIILYGLLLAVVAWGIIWGFINDHSLAKVFLDANGYLYLLILPAVLTGIKNKQGLENLLKILAAAIMIIAAKTLILFVWFSYDLPGVASLYHWVINRDIGEITGVVGSASRIFMQSQFWALVGLFIFGLPLLSLRGSSSDRGNPTKNRPVPSDDGIASSRFAGFAMTYLVISAALLSVILSLSRSFWLGLAAGLIFALIVMLFYLKANFRKILKLSLTLLVIAVIEIGILYLLILGTGGFAESVSSRGRDPVQEAAGGARLLLLPELLSEIKEAPILGKGFGETVTYKSYLPDKITPQNPAGEITTFAFEWGYLDIILKIGLIGLLVYLFFIAAIFQQGWQKLQILDFRFEILGLLSGLVALLVLNITTPYLNHPLGIGYLVLVASYLFVLRKYHEALS